MYPGARPHVQSCSTLYTRVVAEPGHVEGSLQAVLMAGGAVHPVQTGLSYPCPVEGVFPGRRVEVAEYINVFKVLEDITQGGGALITIVVLGLVIQHQQIPVTG